MFRTRQIAIATCLAWATAVRAAEPQSVPAGEDRGACERGVSAACPAPVAKPPDECGFKMNGGGDGRARVELRGGRVEALSVSTLFPGTSQTCSCSVDLSRGAEGTTWQQDSDGRVTIRIAADELDPEDVVTLSPAGPGFWVDLRRTTPGRWCGACAELPDRVLYAPGAWECQAESE